MDELNLFEDIAPYNDEEAAAALSKLAEHPNVPWISKYIFSNQPETYLRTSSAASAPWTLPEGGDVEGHGMGHREIGP